MAENIFHAAGSRGHANHGWLDTHHTFSFANYYDPDRIHFGALRVLNDDVVAPGKGFGTHPHDNMEIISIPLEGDLEHRDSMENVQIIRKGDIQVMSAGTGIMHSEYNKNGDRPVNFLQIWVIPNKRNVKPRYDQVTLDPSERQNRLQQVVSPVQSDSGVWIQQNAWFHLGIFGKNKAASYALKLKGNGIYAFVISGSFIINGQTLHARDGMGLTGLDILSLEAKTDGSEVLLIEVPMIIL